MAVFIALVFVAYVYLWKKGGLEWERPEGRRAAMRPEGTTPDREVARAG